jgi:hypothetical protein
MMVENERQAIELCGALQKIMRRIEESNLHDIEKTSFVIFLSEIRDTVEIEEAEREKCD